MTMCPLSKVQRMYDYKLHRQESEKGNRVQQEELAHTIGLNDRST